MIATPSSNLRYSNIFLVYFPQMSNHLLDIHIFIEFLGLTVTPFLYSLFYKAYNGVIIHIPPSLQLNIISQNIIHCSH